MFQNAKLRKRVLDIVMASFASAALSAACKIRTIENLYEEHVAFDRRQKDECSCSKEIYNVDISMKVHGVTRVEDIAFDTDFEDGSVRSGMLPSTA